MKPRVFINNINKNIKNNEEMYHYEGSNDNSEMYHFDPDKDIIDISDKVGIRGVLNDIFSSSDFVYKSRVIITLKDKSTTTEDIIAVKDNNIITLDNKKIPIDDILYIKKAN